MTPTQPPTPANAAAWSLPTQFRQHFGHRDHLYGELLHRLADDLEAGGPTAQICRDQLTAVRADAVPLRLLAGIFDLVLAGRAPELVRFYPCLGGEADPVDAWPHVRGVLARHTEQLREALSVPPQTNEVGRSAVLAIGLIAAVRRSGLSRVRLYEVGAAAGLNLNVDRYRIRGPGWVWGPEDAPLQLDTGLEAAQLGPVPEVSIIERRGCDLAPIDPTTEQGARCLTSFVWPFDVLRHQRLAAALRAAAAHPVRVDRAPASSWLGERLDQPAAAGVLTVVWQSITEQYWGATESAAVAEVVEDARDRMLLAHLSMEGVPPVQGTDGYRIAEHGPQLRLDGQLIARSHHHGPPIELSASFPRHVPSGT